ncbi:YheC/YheD family endospore coat-associated protein [Paenibacillus silviterrae]|uniref:YheC/YheD family endospore coat-associated protein n=1 Tax=Paenibacillus silviterrae TaxID=3242194 RepID=UPI002543EC91|nr:YheC/YheD family protein [Paenibacillus chinjuensis]
MIGILYPRTILRRLMKGAKSFERPAFYMDAANRVGEEVIFFSLSDIDWRKGTIKGWTGSGKGRTKCLLPPVVINRTRTNLGSVKRTIERVKQRGCIVFNEHNVVSKLEIHHILSNHRKLLPYLPATHTVSEQSVRDLLNQNACLFLKPGTASVGNGIIRIRREKKALLAEFNQLGRTKTRKVGLKAIVKMVRKQRGKNYLIQQGISLMKYKGNPVDFRVSIQKDGSGRWQYTGMVGKIARKGAIVTNLHCGGTSMKAAELFKHWGWNQMLIECKVAKLGLRVARALERELPHIADLGLDVAIDDQQHPWFIEANFRDLRVTFRDARDKETWRQTFANPIYYASYLLQQRRLQEECASLQAQTGVLEESDTTLPTPSG